MKGRFCLLPLRPSPAGRRCRAAADEGTAVASRPVPHPAFGLTPLRGVPPAPGGEGLVAAADEGHRR